MKNYRNLIDEVIKKNLCCYCGTCEGVCPVNAIEVSINNIKEINNCTDCELCYKCCPGMEFDYVQFSKDIFNTDFPEIDSEIGFYKKICKGYSNDKAVREKSSSGGAVTAILAGLLEEDLIDAAIVAGSTDSNDFNSDVKIAKDKNGFIEASQSKYTIISTNKIINKLNNKHKYAFVGLPCQIHGLRKAENNVAVLKDKIIIHIGLFCGFNLYPSATEFLLKKLKIEKTDIKNLKYRSGTGSGGFKVELKKGKKYFIEKHAYTFLNMIFTPRRCWKCFDFTSEFSDISVGDAWENIEGGWSRIISRTSTGNEILKLLSEKKYISVKESSKKDIILTQNHLISYKKKWFWVRSGIIKNMPFFNIKMLSGLKISDKISGFLLLLAQVGLSSNLFKKVILPLLPLKFLMVLSKSIRNNLTG
jgi:coenzyme F420 hydrogenase subunit beta